MNLHRSLRVESAHHNLVEIDFLQVKKASLFVRALNHPLRKAILLLLQEKARLTVTEIYTRLQIEQSVVSQSLAIMRRVGLVKTEREGKLISYEIHPERLKTIVTFVEQTCSING